MKQGKGLAVYPGAAVGRAYVFRRSCAAAPAVSGTPQQEQARFDEACKTADEQLGQLAEKTRKELGDEQAMILEVQQMMLQDQDFLDNVAERIAKGAAAAEAVQAAGEQCSAEFAALEDAYMKARAADIRDITRRLVAILSGGGAGLTMEEPGILVADDLGPSETIQLPRNKILAFVTKQGSANSHTAILARILNIPSLVQADIELEESLDGKQMAVDGFAGTWYIEPDAATLAEMDGKRKAQDLERRELESWRGKPSVTKNGQAVRLYANIGCAEDAKTAMENDAEGIGLMRSEFLYLGRETCPSEEELYTAYRDVVEAMQGRPVVVRALDIGADKQVDYFGLKKEENPALGKRGIRICLDREDIFRDEMRAIYRAAAAGPISVMFPMIASAWEVEKAKAFCEKVEAELAEQGIPHGKPELGIMIETPAAAICSEQLAKMVDFFSVGTNDLTQYTLAADRQNAEIAPYCDPHHPAVLALLEHIAKSAKKAGIWAGICGELAADPELTDTFLKMGYDELSVSPGRILGLRKRICESEV
jgi:phosphotransferase system enzyme I (PtsI)